MQTLSKKSDIPDFALSESHSREHPIGGNQLFGQNSLPREEGSDRFFMNSFERTGDRELCMSFVQSAELSPRRRRSKKRKASPSKRLPQPTLGEYCKKPKVKGISRTGFNTMRKDTFSILLPTPRDLRAGREPTLMDHAF